MCAHVLARLLPVIYRAARTYCPIIHTRERTTSACALYRETNHIARNQGGVTCCRCSGVIGGRYQVGTRTRVYNIRVRHRWTSANAYRVFITLAQKYIYCVSSTRPSHHHVRVYNMTTRTSGPEIDNIPRLPPIRDVYKDTPLP